MTNACLNYESNPHESQEPSTANEMVDRRAAIIDVKDNAKQNRTREDAKKPFQVQSRWHREVTESPARSSQPLGWTLVDLMCASLCGGFVSLLRAVPQGPSYPPGLGRLALLHDPASVVISGLMFGISVALFSRLAHSRHLQHRDGPAHEGLQIIMSVTFSALIVYEILNRLGSHEASRVVVESEIFFTFWTMVLVRAFWRQHQMATRHHAHAGRYFAIAGISAQSRHVRDYLTSLTNANYQFKGFITLDDADVVDPSEPLIGSIEGGILRARAQFIDEIFFIGRPKSLTLMNALNEARASRIDVRLIPDISETLRRRAGVHYIGDMPTIVLHQSRTHEVERAFKRLLDVIGSALLLVLLIPVFIALAIIIKLDSPGPVFYASERVGLKGRTFRCLKFRTMVSSAHQLKAQLAHLNERDGVLFKITNDPRITRVGKVLRKYSLDELAQLWNVFRGDMSLVGPRPPIGDEVAQYELDQFCRLEVMPGITGLWQVEARDNPSFERYMDLDRQYVTDWSIWFDFKILFRTINVVIRGTGT